MGILEIQVKGSYIGKTFSLNSVEYIYVVGSHFCILLGYRWPFGLGMAARNPPFACSTDTLGRVRDQLRYTCPPPGTRNTWVVEEKV